MNHADRAVDLFKEGYNCAQAVAMAFCEELNMTPSAVARMASSFGGGMGRMREVCGAVSGMLLVAGILYGYDTSDDDTAKKAHYALVQQLAGQFREKMGSIVCRELLKNPPSDPAPTPRSAEFYQKRPCARMVYLAAKIMEDHLADHPTNG